VVISEAVELIDWAEADCSEVAWMIFASFSSGDDDDDWQCTLGLP
jgi:hypothetical protein